VSDVRDWLRPDWYGELPDRGEDDQRDEWSGDVGRVLRLWLEAR
jgi:hypothetical protein